MSKTIKEYKLEIEQLEAKIKHLIETHKEENIALTKQVEQILQQIQNLEHLYKPED